MSDTVLSMHLSDTGSVGSRHLDRPACLNLTVDCVLHFECLIVYLLVFLFMTNASFEQTLLLNLYPASFLHNDLAHAVEPMLTLMPRRIPSQLLRRSRSVLLLVLQLSHTRDRRNVHPRQFSTTQLLRCLIWVVAAATAMGSLVFAVRPMMTAMGCLVFAVCPMTAMTEKPRPKLLTGASPISLAMMRRIQISIPIRMSSTPSRCMLSSRISLVSSSPLCLTISQLPISFS